MSAPDLTTVPPLPDGMLDLIRSLVPSFDEVVTSTADNLADAPQATLPAIYVHLLLARIGALEGFALPKQMAFAPPGDGWLLGRLTPPKPAIPAWRAITRTDGGWRDEHGFVFEPEAWLPFPNPQPSPTGWRPLVRGMVVIEPFEPTRELPNVCWAIRAYLEDGSPDPLRPPQLALNIADARFAQRKMAQLLGVPAKPFTPALRTIDGEGA